ncbi:MAG: hypothetical protein NWF04_09735 [Candidatus Bathyarchaeota archaeon]|nr:hypothetical protein [Candidatus Bathyarchaeota archaeon]
MNRKVLLLLLLMTMSLSILLHFSTNISRLPWTLMFLESGYSFGLIPFELFLGRIDCIFLIILGISSLLFSIGFYLSFRNKISTEHFLVKLNKSIPDVFSVFCLSILICAVLYLAPLIVFLPQVTAVGANIDQFVTENEKTNLPDIITHLRNFLTDNNYQCSWEKNESVFEIDRFVFTNYVDKLLVESFGISRGDLILFQGWGACGQTAILTEEILSKCGYETRRASFLGLDHSWAEVMYNGNWTIVDPGWSKSVVDIHNLGEYYPEYRLATGVKIIFANGTIINEYLEYGYTQVQP